MIPSPRPFSRREEEWEGVVGGKDQEGKVEEGPIKGRLEVSWPTGRRLEVSRPTKVFLASGRAQEALWLVEKTTWGFEFVYLSKHALEVSNCSSRCVEASYM